MRRAALKKLCWSMIVALILNWSGLTSLPAARAVSEQAQEGRAKAAEKLKRLFEALEAAQQEIPRDTFDPKAIIEMVGKDPIKLFEWVRDETVLVPYAGVLRGPIGVLMDRYGNSLDRALLLHKLLRESGHDVRLARGRLSPDQVKKVLKRSRQRPKRNDQAAQQSSAQSIDELLAEYARDYQLDPMELRRTLNKVTVEGQRMAEDVAQRVAEQTEALIAAVGLPDPSAEEEERTRQRKALQDHWWVQWQKDSKWVDLDPTHADAQPMQALTQADSTKQPKNIEADLYHKVTVRVVVEFAKKGKLEETTVLSQDLVPCGLLGKRIVLRHVPMNLPEDHDLFQDDQPLKRLKETVLAQVEWMPMLTVDSDKYYKYIFSVQGDIFDSADFHPTTTRLGKAIGRATDKTVGEATDLFKTLPGKPGERRESTEEKMVSHDTHLTAEWIEYEICVPGREDRTIRRQVFDLLEVGKDYNRSALHPRMNKMSRLNRGFSLLRETEILLTSCNISGEFIGYLMAKSLLKEKNLLMNVFTEHKDITNPTQLKRLTEIEPLQVSLYGLARMRQQLSRFKPKVYIDLPNILSHQMILREDMDNKTYLRQGIDIVVNRVAVLPGAASQPFRARIEQGVLDTNVEAALFDPTGRVENTARLFEQLNTTDGKWITIRDRDDSRLLEIQMPKKVRLRVEQDLRRGFVVVLPKQPLKIANRHAFGWWRVDPITGESLGIGEEGMGSAFFEWLMVKINVQRQTMMALRFAGCTLAVIGVSAYTAIRNDFTPVRGFKMASKFIICAFSSAFFGMPNTSWYYAGSVIGPLNLADTALTIWWGIKEFFRQRLYEHIRRARDIPTPR